MEKFDYGCQKCPTGSEHPYTETVGLLGLYYARLCVHHRNAWHRYIVAHPSYALFRELEIAEAAAIMSGNTSEACEAFNGKREMEPKLFAAAEVWCADREKAVARG